MKNKVNFSSTFSSPDTLDAWNGGGYFKILWELEIFGFRIVIWRKI